MVKIEDIFRAALKISLSAWGDQTLIAKIAGMTPQKLHKYLTGELKRGTEDDRRAIARALGYSDYETFLDIGRQALGLPLVRAGLPLAPAVANYLDKIISVLEGPKGAALRAVIDAFGEK